MIEVRIRLGSQSQAVHLCTWDVTDLDALPALVDRWGIEVDDGKDTYGTTGGFAYRDGQAYFELVVHDEDDG